MSAADGGPAFPSPGVNIDRGPFGVECRAPTQGLSLRDYFAAKALRGVMQMVADGKHEPSVTELHMEQVDFIAKSSYELADAMLKARQA